MTGRMYGVGRPFNTDASIFSDIKISMFLQFSYLVQWLTISSTWFERQWLDHAPWNMHSVRPIPHMHRSALQRHHLGQ